MHSIVTVPGGVIIGVPVAARLVAVVCGVFTEYPGRQDQQKILLG